MKTFNHFLVLLCLLAIVPFVVANSQASKIKQGDKVTIVTPGTVARLCPYPNCGQDQHITRIPKGTVLPVEGIMDVKSGIMTVKWFEVTYKGNRGWISIFDTDKQ
jgi:hypothetical protein